MTMIEEFTIEGRRDDGRPDVYAAKAPVRRS